jgi:hypothetical protein
MEPEKIQLIARTLGQVSVFNEPLRQAEGSSTEV